MAGFNSVLKSLGYATGAVTGGPSQVKAVAGAVAVQGKINGYLQQFGRSIGGVIGPDLFANITTGAKQTGDEETKAFVNKNILTPQTKLVFSWGVAVLLGVVAFFYYRRGK